MNVSDRSVAKICTNCKQLFTTTTIPPTRGLGEEEVICRICKTSKSVKEIIVPYCFQYLVAELAAVNIKTELTCEPLIDDDM
jgi:DNA-directed RNA polymerase I subunit RPA2